MREIQYKAFSFKTHNKNSSKNKPNVCQFELTFGCGLHCRHCYTDCYNKNEFIKKELTLNQIKLILDKVYDAGAVWLCFTGGDPLTRKDFLDVYSYAKTKGFIITIFTSAYSMDEKIADFLKSQPPFVIEMTLNAVGEDLYDKISQVKGSFDKVTKDIELISEAKLPLKIKTQVTKDNLEELKNIKSFIEDLGLEFRPSIDLHARLDGGTAPCKLRLSKEDILQVNGNKNTRENDCPKVQAQQGPVTQDARPKTQRFFRCAIGGGDGIHIDPYGNMFLCSLIRNPSYNLLEFDVGYARDKLLKWVRQRQWATDSKCKLCRLIEVCRICPGRAYVETGDMESQLDYYCRLARMAAGKADTYADKG